ncbi:hypothetical protein MAMP_02800 [Methylophaga aminisulfidivorans MP]|uniref:Uncharacterized protein n=1 Tax=Methylophaga aminisulfidivorans MP TaxID=1026882 RepID=F5SUH8_9GAMM|nr:hypothetical protein MAMP_02800 [Methylophaga aminisulfidivorans MP]
MIFVIQKNAFFYSESFGQINAYIKPVTECQTVCRMSRFYLQTR